ncbi:MAG: RNA polymerase sigma-70 factor [Prolixibacteraceae bacterium]|jgi:RNA polymerase sigma-70 factor (ECF subfamily)|nr:RNA polymerase sigma-70 factor [Prolixibacteraceae bacterium]
MSEEQTNPNEYLLSELKNGREEAFDFIFRKYYKALCAQAVSYVSGQDTAQSLVQDCFIKLWEKRAEVTEIGNLSSYLSLMVRNQCIDHLRKEKSMELLHKKSQVCEDKDITSETIIYREFEEKLVMVLASLPDRSRMAFEYSRFEGLSYAEIAARMNISTKGVEALISRALKILRHELKEYLPIAILLYKITHH